MKTVLCLCAILLLACCTGCEPDAKSNSFGLEVASVQFLTWPTTGAATHPTQVGEAYTDYLVTMRIYGKGAGQEVTYHAAPDARRPAVDFTFVEYFGIKSQGWEYATDTHSGRNHSTRSMVLYEASTTGCDYMNGYAMLPANIDGSVVTTPSAVDRGTSAYDMRANPYYLDSHEVRGEFTSVGTKRIEWTITADDSGVTIMIDGVASFHAAP